MHKRWSAMGALLTLAGCSESAAIEGTVTDHAGAPLAGVEVRVLKSAYTTTTDESGSYSVPFAPGSFQVSYSRQGYTSQVLDLAIQESVVFPAEPIQLFAMPDSEGLFVLSGTGTSKLEPAPVETMKVGGRSWYSVSKLHCSGEGPTLAAGTTLVIDTSSAVLLPARLADYGLFYRPKESEAGEYNGLFKDETERVGQEGLVVRTLDLQPGNYAFVTFTQTRDGERDIDADEPCYPFKVE